MTSVQQPIVDGLLSSNTPFATQHHPDHLDRGGYRLPSSPSTKAMTGHGTADLATSPGRSGVSPSLSQAAPSAQPQGHFNEEWDASQRGSSIIDGPTTRRPISMASQGEMLTPSRGGTLKKKASLRRGNSLKRSSSRRSSRAGSVRSLVLEPEENETNSAFYLPIPTNGNPTEVLANRFSTWRKVLKDLITYFREIHAQYDQKAKGLLKVSNVINNTAVPPVFLASGGIHDTLRILRDYHSQAIMEANKAKTIENDVILALTGLKSDLQQKVKEIRHLSGDFKNSVEKEMDNTRKAVRTLVEALGQSDIDTSQKTGKQDPYLLKIAVDRQLERQIDEENYLHQAYLNLETSGRELESIVVGEIQKAFNAYAGILKREADEAYNTVDTLRAGPISMPKDREWTAFIERDENFVDPRISIREVQNIHYPGRDHELASEVRAGLLERKSKYLKSYTAGWYVLTPTHLHEFKSADKAQAPIMSLYLPEQKLGSHSVEGGSSNKFIVKGRQTGTMHRGHSWVFRAESYDTMMAWYEDIKNLTEKSPQERSEFVRQHARSVSGMSHHRAGSISSDGALDEEDDEPFSAGASGVVTQGPKQDVTSARSNPGGRFPSDLQVNTARGLLAAQDPLSRSSGSSGNEDVDTRHRDIIAAAADLPGSGVGENYKRESSYGLNPRNEELLLASQLNRYAEEDGINPYTNERIPIEKDNAADHGPIDKNSLGLGLGASSVEGPKAYGDSQAADAPQVVTPVEDNISASNQSQSVPTKSSELVTPGVSRKSTAAEDSGVSKIAHTSARQNDNSFVIANKNHGASVPPTNGTSITSVSTGLSSPTDESLAVLPRSQNKHKTLPEKSEPSLQSKDAVEQSKNKESMRPRMTDGSKAGQNHKSIGSASELHVPGEFPKAEISTSTFK